jgi:hypothetical protein
MVIVLMSAMPPVLLFSVLVFKSLQPSACLTAYCQDMKTILSISQGEVRKDFFIN